MLEEKEVIVQLLTYSSTVQLLERVGAAPQDTGDTSSAFPGIRVLSNPTFSSSPVIGRKGASNASNLNISTSGSPLNVSNSAFSGSQNSNTNTLATLAYAKFDYRGSIAADTLTMARGEALLVLEVPSEGARWCKCRLRDSTEEGFVPTSFLDSALFDRVPLGRERALSRAGTTTVPISSPLRKKPQESNSPSMSGHLSGNQVGGGGQGTSTSDHDSISSLGREGVRSMDEMSNRMDILSRALVREKEERIVLEKRLQALVDAK